jgi:hypothetical protein
LISFYIIIIILLTLIIKIWGITLMLEGHFSKHTFSPYLLTFPAHHTFPHHHLHVSHSSRTISPFFLSHDLSPSLSFFSFRSSFLLHCILSRLRERTRLRGRPRERTTDWEGEPEKKKKRRRNGFSAMGNL